jgi:hypothetical protein
MSGMLNSCFHLGGMLPESIVQFHILISRYQEALDCLCGLVVRVPGYRSRGLGSIPGATRFS